MCNNKEKNMKYVIKHEGTMPEPGEWKEYCLDMSSCFWCDMITVCNEVFGTGPDHAYPCDYNTTEIQAAIDKAIQDGKLEVIDD